MTVTRPTLMPAICLLGLAIPVWLAEAAAPVPVEEPVLRLPLLLVRVPVAPEVADAGTELVAWASKVWPIVGRATLPLTSHAMEVYAGHSGAEFEGEYADSETPEGVRVFQWLERFWKSGEIGVGVPVRV